ncbi:hypothetical protein B0181_01375 [Moraxella caviae]|uniref:Uncharacterized protein n=1 Tax=Moraxella caviae TaxID=34060 RepID=A0A1T0AAQ8_9GAMM|nr:hypothetical protein [Moraxella caviae]OOR92812.1 hypothetical protein B0181_01375 [Moraxella caviae]STZ14150.1 Uncharacterised protein [Moraxella caviae]
MQNEIPPPLPNTSITPPSGELMVLDVPNKLPMGESMSWIQASWQIFKAQPLHYIGLVLHCFCLCCRWLR